ALITGITGQDGSYLSELLLAKGYEVHGIVRRSAIEDPEHRMSRIKHILPQLKIHSGSIESFASIFNVIKEINPDECYHLAAQSFVAYSFEDEFSTLMTNIDGTHHVLSAVKQVVPSCRFYFAASSEMFGNAEPPQNENTNFQPRSAYGISKLTGYHLVRNYREAYGMFAVNGILFNHESPRRGFEFVTRKISSYAVRIKLGLAKDLKMGNLEAKRDWGHSKDYVNAMWMMLQTGNPEDYVIGTGESHSVREFLQIAFDHLGLDYQKFVTTDPQYYRPAEIYDLVADASKARKKLGWKNNYQFVDLVKEMVESDLESLKRGPM
ncbi:MAG: GDP-mannose 4,6-dehydratase, partial [Deltaproteobacteria bacterium]|nr:GDP-mannose 4,6-dehydratase [Deltaproteobacteria bacterium]